MPELDAVLAAHVAWLRLLRRSERTIYERERAVIRLAARLCAYPHSSTHNALTSQDEGASERLLHATAADLAAWRASPPRPPPALPTPPSPTPALCPAAPRPRP